MPRKQKWVVTHTDVTVTNPEITHRKINLQMFYISRDFYYYYKPGDLWMCNDDHIVLGISWWWIADSAKTILSLWKLFLANDLQALFFLKR